MSIFDLREKYLKVIENEEIQTQMLNGVKDMSQYEFLYDMFLVDEYF